MTASPGATVATAPREALAGLVERVTFHNADNGFCVLRVKARGQRDLVTVVGHAAQVSAGEWVSATGVWVNDRQHGPACCTDPECEHTRPNPIRDQAMRTEIGRPSSSMRLSA